MLQQLNLAGLALRVASSFLPREHDLFGLYFRRNVPSA